ncbi:Gfo/Idh/MocA family oxidoreductase [bacterium]|nr:Gfo/Idh/MocA family oxidoreductase [bacterium]
MATPYSVVVVGLGKRGTHHATAFRANPRFKLVGVCDVDAARLEKAKKEFGVEGGTDAAALARACTPDVFCFCTLPRLRLPLIKAGIAAGAKLIAFEKPMATSTAEALEIMSLVRAAKVKTVVSHQHRYGVHYRKVKEIIASGALGRVHTVYGEATGWMMHMITHLIDYTRWYNDGAEAEWVMAQAAGRNKLADNHPSPDYIAGVVQFANGVRGIYECGAGAPDQPEVAKWWGKCRMGAQGTEGFAEVLTNGGWRAVTKRNGYQSGDGAMNYELDMPPYVDQMADWLDDGKKVHECNGESAYKGLEIMMALCRSVVQRGQITLPLAAGEPEIDALAKVLPDAPVIATTPASAEQYR